jgi:hypothetical protein
LLIRFAEEAERLCDGVAILNTSLRTIGRRDELRDRARTTGVPLVSAESVAIEGSCALSALNEDGRVMVIE